MSPAQKKTWDDVVALASRLGVRVRVEYFRFYVDLQSRIPDDDRVHEAPMWLGWIDLGRKEIVCDPDSMDGDHPAARLLHELSHVVCGIDEADVLQWEVYAARVLWGPRSRMYRRVVRYQISTIDDYEMREEVWEEYKRSRPDPDRTSRPNFARDERRKASARLSSGLPPELGPDPRPHERCDRDCDRKEGEPR